MHLYQFLAKLLCFTLVDIVLESPDMLVNAFILSSLISLSEVYIIKDDMNKIRENSLGLVNASHASMNIYLACEPCLFNKFSNKYNPLLLVY